MKGRYGYAEPVFAHGASFGARRNGGLSGARVAIFGIGGVGGFTAEALARSGVGTLDLIDDDKICLTNINRQIFATRKTVGQYKVVKDLTEMSVKTG